LKDRRAESIEKIGAAISSRIGKGSLLGLGSGSTMAALLPYVVRGLGERRVKPRWVPTSLQIALVAQGLGQETTAMDRPALDMVVDGADQIDADLNLIKGGGGALFREKVVISSAKRTLIVADERKLADKLCSGGVSVPVEAHPFARVPVVEKLARIGGAPRIRIGERGFPFYTENGNVLFDTAFGPVGAPSVLEREIKSIAGVVESGIFTPTPIEVYVIQSDGGFRVLSKD
jgi:ribose 5-phosphate isomerase A